MKKWISTLITLLFCFAAGIIHAQIRPRSLVDFTGGTPLTGVPPISPGTDSSSGATILPGNMPFGEYTNAAGYPLQINATVWSVGLGETLHAYVNGQRVLTADSSGNANGNFIVPAGATFKIHARRSYSHTQNPNEFIFNPSVGQFLQNEPGIIGATPYYSTTLVQVTALANGATWQQTGISFDELVSTVRPFVASLPYVRTPYPAPSGGPCHLTFIPSFFSATFRNNLSGLTRSLNFQRFTASCTGEEPSY